MSSCSQQNADNGDAPITPYEAHELPEAARQFRLLRKASQQTPTFDALHFGPPAPSTAWTQFFPLPSTLQNMRPSSDKTNRRQLFKAAIVAKLDTHTELAFGWTAFRNRFRTHSGPGKLFAKLLVKQADKHNTANQ